MNRAERLLVDAFLWVEDHSRPVLAVAFVVCFLALIWAVRS